MPHPDFPGADGYLNTASLGLPPAPALAAMRDALADWAAGRATAPGYDPYVARSREAWAGLHGVDPACVAIGPQVSYFTGLVAASLPPGSEVVSYEGDFASLLYPFLARGDLNVRLVPLEALADSVVASTALVAVSAVQSADGRVADLTAICAAAARHGAMTLVDATQASGWLPIDAGEFDFLVAGAYKWLLSPRGTAFMWVRPERARALPALAPGWYSADRPWDSVYGAPLRQAPDARRLDLSPAWLCWVGTAAALGYLAAAGITTVHAHDVRLANLLRAGLGEEPGDSAVVSVARPGAIEVLTAAGLHVGGLAGTARICFHLYNTEDDVDRVLGALGAARTGGSAYRGDWGA